MEDKASELDIRDLKKVIRKTARKEAKAAAPASPQWATVTAVSDADGCPTVAIDGGATTQCDSWAASSHVGDRVRVLLQNHKLHLLENHTKAAVTETEYEYVKDISELANELLDGVAETVGSVDKTVAEILADSVEAAELAGRISDYEEGAHESLENILGDARRADATLSEMQQAAADANTTLTGIFQDAADAKADAAQAASDAAAAASSAASAASDAQDAASSAASASSSATSAATAATAAQSSASTAASSATAAQGSASTAASAASAAASDASSAASSARSAASDAASANTAANGAVTGLATVQQVVESLGQDVDEMQAHVAMMDAYPDGHGGIVPAGLHIVPNGNGYFTVLAADGKYLYDSNNNLVTKSGESIEFSSSREQYIGGEDAYIMYYDANDDGVPDSILISGDNVTIGNLGSISDIISRIDGNIETWFTEHVPSASNYPANEWTTATEKARHVGDLCYNNVTGFAYRWTKATAQSGAVSYSWVLVVDNPLSDTVSKANSALQPSDVSVSQNSTATGYDVTIGSETFALVNGQDGANGKMIYATCSVASSTQQKGATLSGGTFTNDDLVTGVMVAVKFTYYNTASSPTLKVGSSDAKGIMRYGTTTPGTSANYSWQSGSVVNFVYDGTYWQMMDWNNTVTTNTDTYDRVKYNNAVKAAAAITSGKLACGTSSGFRDVAAGAAFDLSYPLLCAAASVSSGSTSSNVYLEMPGVNFKATGTVASAAAYAMVYLKGTVSGNTFTVASSDFLTCAIPTVDDGFAYIPIGVLYSVTSSAAYGRFITSRDLYAYRAGVWGPISVREAAAAAQTATKYIADISNGIMVHPEGDSTSGWKIADALELLKSGVTYIKAWLNSSNKPCVQIGEASQANVEITPTDVSVKGGSTRFLSLGPQTWSNGIPAGGGIIRFTDNNDCYISSSSTGGLNLSASDDKPISIFVSRETQSETIPNGSCIGGRFSVTPPIHVSYPVSLVSLTATTKTGASSSSDHDVFRLYSDGTIRADSHIQDMSGNRLYADASHSHAISDVTNLQTTLNGKASSTHSHAISDVTNLQTTLNGKASSAHSHAASDITSGILPVSCGGTGVSANPALLAYPVGAIYMSVNSTSPATLFGGEWERITGKFLLAATDGGAAGGNSNASIAAGNTGGEASHTLSSSESGNQAQTVTSGAGTNHSHGANGDTYFVTTSTTSAISRSDIKPGSSTAVTNVLRSTGGALNRKSTTSGESSHTHSVSIDAKDAASAHNNMPPYLAVYVWKRTA